MRFSRVRLFLGTLTALFSSCSPGALSSPDDSEGVEPGRTQERIIGPAPTSEIVSNFERPLENPNRLVQAPNGILYGTVLNGGNFSRGALVQVTTAGVLGGLHHFSGSDGAAPRGRLAVDASGTLYGSTSAGGTNGLGTLFRWTSGTGLQVLHNFRTVDGAEPSTIALGSDGALYGTARVGGANNLGTLFKWSAASGLQVLHAFSSATGSFPHAGVIQATDGALYGTTDRGGLTDQGTLFKWSAATGHALLVSLDLQTGARPLWAGLVQAPDGTLYGTTTQGGTNNFGTLFQWQSATGLTVLHAFRFFDDGAFAYGGVIRGSDGALYGTTSSGGGTSQHGRVFRWTAATGLTSLHAFTFTGGANPQWGVVQASDGLLYGTVNAGLSGYGGVFKISVSGTGLTAIHQFGQKPFAPIGRVSRAPDGSLRGTSSSGGVYKEGALFRVQSGTTTLLHSFNWSDGSTPETGLVRASDGTYYGTTTYGADGCGTLFRWQDVGGLSTLHTFSRATSGCFPAGGVIQGTDGAFYGTTLYGGTNEAGTLFRWNGTFTVLHHFSPATSGASPFANGVVQGSDGALYGTTSSGGSGGAGTVFQWKNGALTVLHAFASSGTGGKTPMSGVIQGVDGALYGTTAYGGPSNLGTLFKRTAAGVLTTLYSFDGSIGSYPNWPLAQRSDGLLYGAIDGATAGSGNVLRSSTAGVVDGVFSSGAVNGKYPSAWLVPGAANDLYGTMREGGAAGGGTLYRLVFSKTLVSIAVTPGTASIAKGLTRAFVATGTYDDGTVQTITTQVTWSSSAPAVATVSNTSGSNGLADAEGVGTATISATLDGVSGTAALTVTAPTLVSLEVTPSETEIAKGTTEEFTAIGVYTDGTVADLTTSVTWSSSAPAFATVSNASGSKGVATGVNVGNAVITATLGSLSDSTALTVTAATLEEIDVLPVDPTIAKGTVTQFRAIGTFSDDSSQDLTSSATWSSTASSIATVSNAAGSKGLVTATGVGVVEITASVGSVSDSSEVVVTSAALTSIAVTPANQSVPKGTAVQYLATGTYSDGTKQDLTTQVTWSSTASAVATISNVTGTKGRATAMATGSTTVRATLGAVSGSTSLTVTAATLVSISVTPASRWVARTYKIQMVATGVYSDSSTQDLTTVAIWSSSSTWVATISNAAGTNGWTTVANTGITTLQATYGGKSGSTTLTGTNATLSSITVTPSGTTNLEPGQKLQMTATGRFSDSTTLDITTQVAWKSNRKKIASVSTTGLVTAIKPSNTAPTIKATKSSRTGSAKVFVQ